MSVRKKVSDSKMGEALRVGLYTGRLPKYVRFFETQIELLRQAITAQETHSKKLESKINKMSRDLDAALKINESIDDRINDLKHQLLVDGTKSKDTKSTEKSVNDTMADDHCHDKFYKDFEDRFRGSEEKIKQRLLEYNPYLQSLPKALHKLPVLDLGCGRGEFLEVVKENGFEAIGIDMNHSMVERAKSLGYEAHENDALSYLLEQKKSSFAVISGFHLVEHIPFPSLLKIFEECYRTVHQDGFVLFETPNPNNLTVGASNFYMDPSHIKPLPPKLLAFAMETQGFFTKIIELHPANPTIKHADPVVEDLMRMVYGPLDYAVLASKKPFELAKT